MSVTELAQGAAVAAVVVASVASSIPWTRIERASWIEPYGTEDGVKPAGPCFMSVTELAQGAAVVAVVVASVVLAVVVSAKPAGPSFFAAVGLTFLLRAWRSSPWCSSCEWSVPYKYPPTSELGWAVVPVEQ